MELEEIRKQLETNTERILNNLGKIEQNTNRIDENEKNIQKNSYALEILGDYKKGFNRWHTIAVVFMILWILTICFLIYILIGR